MQLGYLCEGNLDSFTSNARIHIIKYFLAKKACESMYWILQGNIGFLAFQRELNIDEKAIYLTCFVLLK